MNAKGLILGVGSPFADDQVGFLVILKLMELDAYKAMVDAGRLEVDSVDRPGLNLLNWVLRGYKFLLLVDMVKTNQEQAGDIYVLKGRDIIGFSGMLSSHSLGVSESLGLAVALGVNIEQVIFVGIEGKNNAPHDAITPAVLAAIAPAVNQIDQLLAGMENNA